MWAFRPGQPRYDEEELKIDMRLVLIYGPPAAGKLTVASSLAASTGFRLFHNHLTVDCVGAVFDFGTAPFVRLVDKIRIDLIEEAAREKIDGLIFTFVYANPQDNRFIDRITSAVERHGGEVCFVQLYCDARRLEERVVAESRRKFGKIGTVETLKEVMGRYELFSAVPGREGLSIDNTDLPAEEAVSRIKARFDL